jgi:hypothetical protein
LARMAWLVISAKHLKKNGYQLFSKSSRNMNYRKHFQTHFVRNHINFISKSDKKHNHKLHSSIPHEYRCKIFNEILVSKIQWYIKSIIYCD